MKAPPDHLAPLNAMIALLNEEQREVLARTLHQHVHAPLLASARNVADLSLLARLLEGDVQPPERVGAGNSIRCRCARRWQGRRWSSRVCTGCSGT